MQIGGRIYGSGAKGSVIDIFKQGDKEIINKDYFADQSDKLNLVYYNDNNTEIETEIIDKNYQ